MRIEKQHLLLMETSSFAEVTITPISYKEDLSLIKKASPKGKKTPTEETLHWLRFEAMTGLSESEADELTQPDINTLEHWINVFILSDSAKVAELLEVMIASEGDDKQEPWSIGEGMAVNLLVPLDDGTDSYTLKFPTGKTTKRFNAYDNPQDSSEYISSACTSLNDSQVQQLSTPDWTHLQNRLTDFLSQKADFFLP